MASRHVVAAMPLVRLHRSAVIQYRQWPRGAGEKPRQRGFLPKYTASPDNRGMMKYPGITVCCGNFLARSQMCHVQPSLLFTHLTTPSEREQSCQLASPKNTLEICRRTRSMLRLAMGRGQGLFRLAFNQSYPKGFVLCALQFRAGS